MISCAVTESRPVRSVSSHTFIDELPLPLRITSGPTLIPRDYVICESNCNSSKGVLDQSMHLGDSRTTIFLA
jgi:hypothetical protein